MCGSVSERRFDLRKIESTGLLPPPLVHFCNFSARYVPSAEFFYGILFLLLAPAIAVRRSVSCSPNKDASSLGPLPAIASPARYARSVQTMSTIKMLA